MKKILFEILHTLKHGEILHNSIEKWNYVKEFSKILLLMLIASVLSLFFRFLFLNLFSFTLPPNKVNQRHTNESVFEIIFFSCIIIPILEEFLFRGTLKYSRFKISVLLDFLIVFLFLKKDFLPKIILDSYFVFISIVAVSLFLIIYKYIINNGMVGNLIRRLWMKHPALIFYISFISFGFIHIFNFERETYLLFLLAPIITFPQLVTGIILGYSRLKYGLFFSITVHSFYNLFFIAMKIIIN